MCVLSLIYSYVTVCRFCAVCCPIIICFSVLFTNYSTMYFFNILCMFVICFEFFCLFCEFSVFVLLWYCFFFCMQLSLSYYCTSLLTVGTGWKPKCTKYHQ